MFVVSDVAVHINTLSRYIADSKLTLSCLVTGIWYPLRAYWGRREGSKFEVGEVSGFESFLRERDFGFLLSVIRKMSDSVPNRSRPLSSKSLKIRHSSQFVPRYICTNPYMLFEMWLVLLKPLNNLLRIIFCFCVLYYTHIWSSKPFLKNKITQIIITLVCVT